MDAPQASIVLTSLQERILKHLAAAKYRPRKPRQIAREIGAADDHTYPQFREALRMLLETDQVMIGPRKTIVLPPNKPAAIPTNGNEEHPLLKKMPTPKSLGRNIVIGPYRQTRRGFGFVMPTQPAGHEDLFIAPEDNGGAITGDIVRAQITGRYRREGRQMFEGRIIAIEQRGKTQFAGTLAKQNGQWVVLPDGNDFTQPILAPDAGSRHIKPGTKVGIELTQYPKDGQPAVGVITEVLGRQGEKDVDLRSIIIQYNLPLEFPEECKQQARQALDRFNATLDRERQIRLDLSDERIITIDPDDAKDYDDAISIRRLENGNWQLGVHIADVAFFVEPGTPLDEEAAKRGNSTYFPGFVIPMLPEVLSNGVCSLQEGVPRLTKSVFIELDADARPVGTKVANSIICSAKRLRYREAQAILDGEQTIPHPDGPRRREDYDRSVLQLLADMDELARRIQKRRMAAGQLVLGLPEVDLVLDEEGRVTGAIPEDESYTHTIIEMFMVEANEAVARLLNGLDVPFLRRTHPEPEPEQSERLRTQVSVAGYKLPKVIDRKALQALLESVKDRPDAFAVNLAVLKSLTRAEYSPQIIGHYALASEQYCHFTSPIRRYADLTIHRLIDRYIQARDTRTRDRKQLREAIMEGSPTYEELQEIGKRISFTERRSADAESELRTVKILELMQDRVGEEFQGVVTSVTKFGIFIQLAEYLIDGLVRYEDLGGDWWDVDDRAGVVRGRSTGMRITIGDLATVRVVNVDVPRRELDIAVVQWRGKPTGKRTIGTESSQPAKKAKSSQTRRSRPATKPVKTGATVRNRRSKARGRRK